MVLSLNKVSIVSTRIQTVEEIIPTLMNSQGDVYPSISGLYINDRKKYFEALSKININHLYLMFSGITGKEMENLVLSVKAKYIDLRHNVTSDILKSATLNPNIEILDIRGYEVTEADSTAIAQSNIKALLLSSMPSDNAVMNLLQSKHLKSLNIEFYLYIPNFVYSQPPYIINSDFTISNIELGKLIEIPNKQLQEFIKTLEGNTILTTLNLGTVQSNDFETILTPSLSVHDGIKADEEKQLAKILHRNKKLEEIVSFIKEISDRNETPFDLAKEDRIKIKETLLTIQQFLANPSTILQNHLKTIGYSADEIKIIKCHIHNFINEEFWKITGIVQYGLSNDINTNEAQKTTISDLPELALHKITSYLSLTDIVESTNNSIIIETANHFDD